MTTEPNAKIAGARPVKRSFSIAGHSTSLSLETEFWDALKAFAATDGCAVARMIERIDRDRGDAGLSSAVRVYVLKRLQDEIAGRERD
ncbi:MAG: ribbon-helix-helix domain-containing protein [Pseudomonadota bacterium]